MIAIHTKKNTVTRDGFVTPPHTASMNMSIAFEFARQNTAKSYKLVVFSNGAAKIAGVNDCYACTDVPRLVNTAT